MVTTDMACSKRILDYFTYLDDETQRTFKIAQKARKKGFDPQDFVEIKLAKNMAERVVGIISVVAPQIINSGVTERIIELEKEYASQDWRVAFKIALEIAKQQYCSFKTNLEAIEVGIRTGFAYVTVGVVSAPLEGLTSVEIRKRADGNGEFFRLNYAGPIRNAGGTAAATSVLIADYVRKNLGYAKYDPTEKEIQRCYAELEDYHGYIANLQYYPFKVESEFLLKNIPIEIAGDPSEKRELSNASLKDLPRIETNFLRSGYCLIHSSCIPLKAPKLWKKLSSWGHEMGMEDWDFLGEHIKMQKDLKAKKAAESSDKKETNENEPKIKPDGVFVADIVGGRPVLGHPMRSGGFRLRYGRGRASGYSGQSAHPATLAVLNDMIATGTQLKVERPGKAASFTPCDTIMGPIVKLDDDSVIYLDDVMEANKISSKVKEILYLGDTLVNYGDFFDRAHVLVPPGYVEEIWALEVKKVVNNPDVDLKNVLDNPLRSKVSFDKAKKWSKQFKVPLHPQHIFFYKEISKENLEDLVAWIATADFNLNNISFLREEKGKRALELLGIPHKVIDETKVIIEGDYALALKESLNILNKVDAESCLDKIKNLSLSPLEIINYLAPFEIKDKSGIFIGARMGRPEKAKMRKMTGSPHTLFPVGEEGGRLRSFNTALEKGKVTADFPVFYCENCDKKLPLRLCHYCGKQAERQLIHPQSYDVVSPQKAKDQPNISFRDYKRWTVPIRDLWDYSLKKLKTRVYPDLIKGVRGTVGRDHTTEHLLKGILRARNDVHVNKDGTVRYDASEITLTHFKPNEIDVSIEKLKKLGYKFDIYNDPLVNDNQVLELLAQDIVLPACPDSPEDGSDKVLINTAKFIDEELQYLYGLTPFYNVEKRDDLIGHLVIGLAPHTSAGIIGRIIGFSKTQGLFAHPLYHAAMRRDCFSYDSLIPLKKNGSWSVKKIGDVVNSLNPIKLVDDFGTVEANGSKYKTIGFEKGKLVEVPVNNFTKHIAQHMIKFTTKLGRSITTTKDHKHIVNEMKMKCASQINIGDNFLLPFKNNISIKKRDKLDLINLFSDEDWIMVKGLKEQIPLRQALKDLNLKDGDISNFSSRNGVPLSIVKKLLKKYTINKSNLTLSAKRDSVKIPVIITLDEDFLKILGLYVAEGYSRKNTSEKGFYQMYIAASNSDVRIFVKNYFSKWGLKPAENKDDRITYSSRIIYTLFVEYLRMGSSAYKKRLPFIDISKKQLGWLLSGYLEGDGSVSKGQLRICFDTVSIGLQRDIEQVLSHFGVFVKYCSHTSKPGPQLRTFYEKKNIPIPLFTVTKGTIQSKFISLISPYISFISSRKQNIFTHILENKKYEDIQLDFYKDSFVKDEIVNIEYLPAEESYCLNVSGNVVMVDGILTKQCDGDESCVFLLMDAFLNFSQKFLSKSRGSTMDAPLVLTTLLNPAEVDDMAFNVDIVDHYPLEFYEAANNYKYPWDVKIRQINDELFKEGQFEGVLFTHDTSDLNEGVLCSSYKLLPSMGEKIAAQMNLAEKIRAVNTSDVARLIIEKHFIRDTKGNLRKYSLQQFRCVKCNDKYRRPPLQGHCTSCGGKVILTISEGSIMKYLGPSLMLAEKYDLAPYLKQTLEMLQVRIESYFGRDKEKQTGLGDWLGGS